ncbi:MAG: T9SS type A sorting domain-containing protein, partial [Chitinophagales bacterium]
VTDNVGCIQTGSAAVINLCGAATGITTSPTATTVFINWNDVGATGYRVMYKQVGPGPFTTVNTPISQVNISGLSPSTGYTFKIRNKCPGAPGSFMANGNFITNPLKLSETNDLAGIHIYPNPNNGIFTLAGINGNAKIFIYDFSGKLIRSFSVEKDIEIDFRENPNGLYLLKVVCENGKQLNNKIVISQ